MATASHTRLDPSHAAASMLRRLGFAVLLFGLPLGALVTRSGPVLLVPVGVTLLVIATALDGAARPLRETLAGLSASSGVAAFAIGLLWSVLSLAWTPEPGQAADHLLDWAGILSAAFIGYLALPDRMRAANLYLIPVGATLAAMLTILAPLVAGFRMAGLDAGGGGLERGTAVLLLILWPSIAWLRSRERDLEALTLAILISTAALIVGARTPLPVALGFGAIAYALAALSPRVGATICAASMTVAMLVPAIWPYLGQQVPWSAVSRFVPAISDIANWSEAVRADPMRLLTGHGVEALQRARLDGLALPQAAPVVIWYDFGLVGVLSIAAALWCGPRAAVSSYAPLLPGVVAAYATAFTLAAFGIGAGESWWPAALAILALSFVAAERGQFRTRRPRALLFGAGRARA